MEMRAQRSLQMGVPTCASIRLVIRRAQAEVQVAFGERRPRFKHCRILTVVGSDFLLLGSLQSSVRSDGSVRVFCFHLPVPVSDDIWHDQSHLLECYDVSFNMIRSPGLD